MTPRASVTRAVPFTSGAIGSGATVNGAFGTASDVTTAP